ncbi:MAG: BadF/BadG/BcrA/BcrD ATPase family protein, partial [Nitrospirota bacterium]
MVQHITSIIQKEIIVDPTGVYGALGAAFLLFDEWRENDTVGFRSVTDMLRPGTVQKKYGHAPLTLTLSNYPDFGGDEAYDYVSADAGGSYPVEVDIYDPLIPPNGWEVFLGMDIGSTSTKAVLLNADGRIMAGFYTSTAGRPVAAVQNVLSAINDLSEKKSMKLCIKGAATTGSGRKFAGKIMGADRIIDEITAHARAACEIDPDVDTIIEIGGQDS